MINSIVNLYGEKYEPAFGGGLSNHLPMAQVALYKLLDDSEAVTILSDHYVVAAGLEPIKENDYVVDNIGRHLGDPNYYGAYLEYFTNKSKTMPIEDLVKEALSILEKGLVGGAFHTIIKLAYGIESNNKDEIIRALAYFASEYLAVPKAETSISLTQLEGHFDKVIKNLYFKTFQPEEGLFTTRLVSIFSEPEFETLDVKVDGNPDHIYEAMLKYAVEEYLHTGDFLELHTITSLHAIDVLKPYFNDFGQVMNTYVTAYIGCLITITNREEDIVSHVARVSTWNDLELYIKQTMDVHTIKFLYTCRELDKKYDIGDFMTAVNIRLDQDRMINR